MFELRNGQRLLCGQDLVSNNMKYKLIVQVDGNLVLYKIPKHAIGTSGPLDSSHAIWSTQTSQRQQKTSVHCLSDRHGNGTPHFLLMQEDNHLCLYDQHGNCTWNSGTHGKGHGKAEAKMQEDGNFVMYDEHGTALWCTRTKGGGKAEEEYQGCGHNLV